MLSTARSPLISTGLGVLILLVTQGCGEPKVKEGIVAPAYNNLRNLSVAYMQATMALGHPPRSAEQLTPYLAKMGDSKELLKSPIDGADLVICWGVDLRSLKQEGSDFPIWVYEKNDHDGKRWVLQERNPMEMTNEQLAAAPFAPGFKKPF